MEEVEKQKAEKIIQKCVPIAKARAMSKGQRASAVRKNKRKEWVANQVELQHLLKKEWDLEA